jgi:hypothetical protein
LTIIQAEIDLYRIREAYEQSVGRKLVAIYRQRLLRYERDMRKARLNFEDRRKEAGKRSRWD